MQGQGDSTPDKQRGLEAAFLLNLGIFRHFMKKHPGAPWRYWHFDLNAGSGSNHKAGCVGSPVTFLRAAKESGCERFRAAFVEKDESKVRALLARPEVQDPRCYVHHGDNAAFIESIPDLIRSGCDKPSMAMGTVLCDPNGVDVPLDALRQLSETCPHLDIILNWNSVAVKRTRGVFGKGVRLNEAISALGKDHWLIREPAGIWQFVVVIGRNHKIGGHRSLGFYPLDSPEGQRILMKCSYTNEERERSGQGDLLDGDEEPYPLRWDPDQGHEGTWVEVQDEDPD